MDLAHHNRSCASPLTASTDAGYRRAEFFFHWSRRNKLGYDLLLDISKDGAGVSREPPVKTSTESLRQFDKFLFGQSVVRLSPGHHRSRNRLHIPRSGDQSASNSAEISSSM